MLSADPDIEVVGEAATGFEALQRINAHNPDLVTLDVDMPGMDGLSTLRCLKQRRPDLPVIMMSVLTQEGARTTLDALASPSSTSAATGSSSTTPKAATTWPSTSSMTIATTRSIW